MKKKVGPLGWFDEGIAIERKSKIRVNIFFDKQKYAIRDVFTSGKNKEAEENEGFSSTISLDKKRMGTLEITFNTFLSDVEEKEAITRAVNEAIEKR